MSKSREEAVADIRHWFIVLTPEGKEIPIELETFGQERGELEQFPQLIKLINFEVLGKKPGVPPPSIKIMRQLELIDYEPASDSGHFRFYPKGALMLKLLERWAEEIAINRFGAMQIETPILYDWAHPAIRSQGESFHERHYLVKIPYPPDQPNELTTEKEFVLRFAGDFGLFCMVSDAQVSYKHLPLRIYEYSKSYRYERSGELVGLRRLRGFSMPDIHSFCADIKQSWEEYKELYFNYANLADATKVEYAIIFRAVESFYKEHREQILKMLQYSKKPGVIEILSGMKHYWAVKHEFQGLDSVGGACQVATVQLDVEDAEKYGINFTKTDGSKQGCVICHSSIGALERWIFLVLEAACKMEVPQFPLWLAPQQVRIIPVSEKYTEIAVQLGKELRQQQIRAEVDDRSESVNSRVRKAETEWSPFILVVGQKEVDSCLFSVRQRGADQQLSMRADQLADSIKQETAGMPFEQMTLPLLLSRRPIFYG